MKINNFFLDFEEFLSKKTFVSKRQANKFLLALINNPENVRHLIDLLTNIKSISKCKKCNKLTFKAQICEFCTESSSFKTISVFNSYEDLLKIAHNSYDGMQSNFLIGNGNKNKLVNINDINFVQLHDFVLEHQAQEIILMFDKNLKSEILADYIKSFFADTKIKVSTLGIGISLGGSIEFLDESTLDQALKNRGK